MDNLLEGQLVRLVLPEPKIVGEAFAKWSRDAEYSRWLDTAPARQYLAKPAQEWWEKVLEEQKANHFLFMICTLTGDRLIGFVELDDVQWTHGDTFVGIGIGEPDYRGKGYGTDAMRVILRFAFMELNLHRVSLDVFEYNPRAIRSYEKVGFVVEGRKRQVVNRDGRRWDDIYMGILREEWEQLQER